MTPQENSSNKNISPQTSLPKTAGEYQHTSTDPHEATGNQYINNSDVSLTIPDGWSISGNPGYGELVRGNEITKGSRTGDADKQNPTDYPSEDYGPQ